MSEMQLDPSTSSTEDMAYEEETGMPDDNNVSQKEWISELLRKYLAKYVRDFLEKRKDGIPSPVSSKICIPDGNGNIENNSHSSIHSDECKKSESETDASEEIGSNNLKELSELTVTNLEITEETALGDDRITYLSRILSLAANYTVSNAEHFVEWIVKVPSKSVEERNLARETHAYLREVSFYTEILQNIKLWLEHNCSPSPTDSQRLWLNVPTCYYANYAEPTCDTEPEVCEFPNLEYNLILEDLRAQGFGKRHYSMGLTIEEATEAVREIAKFHAICWAMEQHSYGESLHWPNLLMWKDVHRVTLAMVAQGFKHLRQFRQHLTDPNQTKLVDRLLALESKLSNVLEGLLKPLPHPAVTTLIHMDFWADNLLFRETIESNQMEDGATGLNTQSSSNVELDCMIIDWQMVSYGRITHDLGILIMTSMEAEDRRGNGMNLLKYYYDTFERIAKCFKLEVPFEFNDFVRQYVSSCLLATLLSVGRLDLVVSEQSTLTRFFEALADLKDETLI